MPHEIYAYENGIIRCCEKQGLCENCNGSYFDRSCKCCRQHYDVLLELCNSEYIDCLKKERDYIKCLGYTGFFQLSDGTEVYILPKVNKEDKDEGKQIFANLVGNAYSIKNLKLGSSSPTEFNKNDLFVDVLVSIFCGLMEILFKKGLKKFYSPEEDNLPYLKGKIIFSEHIKHNIVSKEKFYCQYDEFTDDIPENRILKSACEHLIKRLNSLEKVKGEKQIKREENIKRLRRFIQEFGDIEGSKNLVKDFAKIQPNRMYQHYNDPLLFAEVFLADKNYWINRGRKKFPAIMFSLHDLFEQYIEKIISKYNGSSFDFQKQYSRYYLLKQDKIDTPNIFRTKMDFVLWNKDESKYLVLDAKYKIINLQKCIENAGKEDEEKDEDEKYKYNKTHVSQSDLYQVFTYSELLKNNIKRQKDARGASADGNVKNTILNSPHVEIALLYPQTDKFVEKQPFEFFNGTKITFIPINLLNNEEDENKDNKFLKEFIDGYFPYGE